MGEASHSCPPRQGLRRAISVPEEVSDDLEVALTRIDSSGSDDEPLVRPSSGRNVMPRRSVAEGSQGGDRRRRLRVVSHTLHEVGSTVVSESPTMASTVPAFGDVLGPPPIPFSVDDSRSTVPIDPFDGRVPHRILPSTVAASSGPLHEIWMSFIQRLGTTRK